LGRGDGQGRFLSAASSSASSSESTASSERTFWDIPPALPRGAWVAKRRLASALRELVALCVTTDAPEGDLAAAAASAEALVNALRSHPQRTFKEGFASCRGWDDLAVYADRGTLVGLCNPFAPPISFTMDGDEAVGSVSFGPAYEGLPGHVHGGLIAAAFDQLFGYLQTRRGVGSLTGVLTVRYREPAPIQTPLALRARVERSEGRKTFVTATLTANERLSSEAEAIFIALDPERMKAMAGAR
jgi:acyl-coenzyme A thioesterase PaaI-like protein